MLPTGETIKMSVKNAPYISFTLMPETTQTCLWKINDSEATDNCEAPLQIMEGCTYEYALTDGYRLEGLYGIVKEFKKNKSGGRITPRIYVGTLSLNVLDNKGERASTIAIEVRSSKTSYREDYRFMLEDITDQCTDLLMQHSSPVIQNFIPDYATDSETVYQRFTFVKSVLESDEFNEAVHRILTAPVTSWSETEEEVDIRRLRRLGSSHLRQIAYRSKRIKLPDDHPLKNKIDTIPARISADRKVETVDTPENRFIKYALEVFCSFCTEVRNTLTKDNGNHLRAYIEALRLEEQLSEILNHDLFREISPPFTLPLNSPVLQRKEGYREVLRVWLMFDLAAKLTWKGGVDVYNAGKRDVAVLYEYWLFFKLIDLLKEIFTVDPGSLEQLIEPTADGLGLKLKSGQHTALKGIFIHRVRDLNIVFSYNRTFGGEKSYPQGGSWSKSMRPDYTLSLWPADFSLNEAENQELIVHIHFDAKYRVEGLREILGDDQVNLDKEKEEQRKGTYKRADLLKMHAYKDAIRRTGGAYVLYPGNEDTIVMKGFHELIPGLGAFAVRPSRTNDGTEHLKLFIRDIVRHLLNRASQHDRMSYRNYDIHKDKSGFEVLEPIPEYYKDKRAIPPQDTFVLIGYYKNQGQYEWIKKNGLYNFRMNSVRGSLRLTPKVAGAGYLLLHPEGELITSDIWKITENGPRVFSKNELIKKGYPDPSGENYLLYKIKKTTHNDFDGAQWDIREVEGYKDGRGSGLPFAVSLAVLMKSKIK